MELELALLDIDADGDLDAIFGTYAAGTVVQLNTGSASAPNFGAATINPYNLANTSYDSSPSFVDIDADGDLDALIGNHTGNIRVQLNIGSANAPDYGEVSLNPYGLVKAEGRVSDPNFVDIDGDGDLDALTISNGNNYVGNFQVQLRRRVQLQP